MRKTLLEIVQDILSAMDSDEVNSIEDTTEATQVATLCRQVYYDIATDIGLPEREGVFQLTALEGSQDPDRPVLMTIPSTVIRISWIKYNHADPDEDDNANYTDVQYLPYKEFLEMMTGYANSESDDVSEMTFYNDDDEEFRIMYRTDAMPKYYSMLGNTLIFDALDTDIEDTLQTSNTICGGIVYPDFDLADDFEPDLDPSEFSYFINKAKTRAFAELKQTQNADSAQEARRQKIIVQKRKRRIDNVPELSKVARYGRR
jgi:hypothetical protein